MQIVRNWPKIKSQNSNSYLNERDLSLGFGIWTQESMRNQFAFTFFLVPPLLLMVHCEVSLMGQWHYNIVGGSWDRDDWRLCKLVGLKLESFHWQTRTIKNLSRGHKRDDDYYIYKVWPKVDRWQKNWLL